LLAEWAFHRPVFSKHRFLLSVDLLPIPLLSALAGGVIAYISSSSSTSSPESCHSDSSNGSYQSSSPLQGSSPSHSRPGQPASTALAAGRQNLPGTQKSGRSSSSGKCGITSKPHTLTCVFKSCVLSFLQSSLHWFNHRFNFLVQPMWKFRFFNTARSCSVIQQQNSVLTSGFSWSKNEQTALFVQFSLYPSY